MQSPTEEQIAYAEYIAEKLDRTINPEWLKNRLYLTMWTKSNKGKLKELR